MPRLAFLRFSWNIGQLDAGEIALRHQSPAGVCVGGDDVDESQGAAAAFFGVNRSTLDSPFKRVPTLGGVPWKVNS
jgi:hypothetical protein